jgi:hypothetical protein
LLNLDGKGIPSFRAWVRTLIIDRLKAAALASNDLPFATKSFSRSLSASVQGPGFCNFRSQ